MWHPFVLTGAGWAERRNSTTRKGAMHVEFRQLRKMTPCDPQGKRLLEHKAGNRTSHRDRCLDVGNERGMKGGRGRDRHNGGRGH